MKKRAIIGRIALLAAASLALTTPATTGQAQTSGLPIAYAKVEGSGAAIYVTNETGIGTTKVYTTPSKATITALDIKPGSQELAFIERRSNRSSLKVLTYANDATTVTVRTLQGPCSPSSVDYHPFDDKLLYTDVCDMQMSVRSIALDGTGLTELIGPYGNSTWLGYSRWSRDGGSIIYSRATPAAYEICRDNCTGLDVLWTGASQVSWFDVGRSTNQILFNAGTHQIQKLNLDTGFLNPNYIMGTDGHFSPDDTQVLFETPHSARGNYLMIRRGSGLEMPLSGKGDFGPKDWRM